MQGGCLQREASPRVQQSEAIIAVNIDPSSGGPPFLHQLAADSGALGGPQHVQSLLEMAAACQCSPRCCSQRLRRTPHQQAPAAMAAARQASHVRCLMFPAMLMVQIDDAALNELGGCSGVESGAVGQ